MRKQLQNNRQRQRVSEKGSHVDHAVLWTDGNFEPSEAVRNERSLSLNLSERATNRIPKSRSNLRNLRPFDKTEGHLTGDNEIGKSLLIDSNPAMGTMAQAGKAVQRDRLIEETSFMDGIIVGSRGNMNRERTAETTVLLYFNRNTVITDRYNRFHKGKAIQVNQRGYRIPFYDRPPASDSYVIMGLWIAISRCKQGELLRHLNSFEHDNQQPSALNGLTVNAKVQRLGQRSQSDNVHQRPGTLLLMRTSCIDRFSQSSFDIPIGTNTIRDDSVRKIDLFCPRRHGLSLITKGKEMITAKVAGLICRRVPNAVRRPSILKTLLALPAPIPSVIILALQRKSFRSMSHVFQEVLKAMLRVEPAFADYDSPTAVPMELDMPSRVTSSAHGYPSLIFRRFRQSMSSAVSSCLLGSFPMKASAGYGMTRSKTRSSYNDLAAAFTLTRPVVFPTFLMSIGERDYCQSAKHLSNQALVFIRHESYYTTSCVKGQGKVCEIVRAASKDAEVGRNDQSLLSLRKKSNKTVFSEGGAMPVADNPFNWGLPLAIAA